jgi:2,3-bisphosphoglycerate-dependent phosphoglycerate mutase
MFTSVLLRAKRTGNIILQEMAQENLKIVENEALNERNYGDLSGLNKDDARKKWGKDQVHQWRRSFDIAPPGGESLKMTAERVIPYYKENILPLLKENQEIIVVAHGNSLRALIMKLDALSPEEIVGLEIPTGMPICYKINIEGKVENKDFLE